jgi:hypothetical protein
MVKLSSCYLERLDFLEPTNVIHLELLVKSEILTSCIYGPTFGNAESRLFLFSARSFNVESMKKVLVCQSGV